MDQPNTIGPAFNNCDHSHVLRCTTPAEEGCMQGEIILSSVPPCFLHHPRVLWIIKKKNSFYGFTSQQPRYAFVKMGGKLEPYVNLNARHLVVIKVMLWMIETHWAVFWESTMDTATLTQIRVKTFIKSKGFVLMNRMIHRLTKNTYAIIMSRSVCWWTAQNLHIKR